jgi:hypothetical protein
MCNHDINDKNTTIILSKKWCGVYPQKIKGICRECKQTFTYIKDNGKLKEI